MDLQAPFFVAVGASGADGLRDLRDLLQALPADLPAVVMVVLHRPSNRISHLRDVLARRSRVPVVIPSEADVFRAGVCYVGEPAAHLSLAAKPRASRRGRTRQVPQPHRGPALHVRGRPGRGTVHRGCAQGFPQ